MTALQVYAILNKRVKGLISGVKSAVVNGTTIIFEMNDGTKVPMTFPTPKDGEDGVSVVNIEIKKITVAGETKKHLLFTMSDNSTIDSGAIDDGSGNIVQTESMSQFPTSGDENTLYISKKENSLFYWDGSKYQSISSDSTNVMAELKTATLKFDGVSDTFDLPLDDIPYNVYVNGVYYTESEDYTIDRTISPNQIIFNEIYDDYESCTLTYLKSTPQSSSSDSDSCSCKFLEYATKDDIDAMFLEGGSDGN